MSEPEFAEPQPFPEETAAPGTEPQETIPDTSVELHPDACAEAAPIAESVPADEVAAESAVAEQPCESAPTEVHEAVPGAAVDAARVSQAIGELKDALDSIAGEIRAGGETASKLDTRLAGMEGRMERLAADFAARLRFDAVKDDVISKQGKELDGFRRGAVAKELGAIIDNLILEIDGTRRIAKRLAAQEPTEANYKKAVEALLDGAEALEDSVLSRAAVKRFETPEGKAFDNVRHVLAKDGHEDTPDASKAGLVARSVRCGYERAVASPDGQTRTVIVRPEQVAIWHFVEATSATPADEPSESPAPAPVEPSKPDAGQTI